MRPLAWLNTMHEAILPTDLGVTEVYRLMTDLIAPRPIAWISSLDAEGRRNLAPFSYFQGVCSRPPTIVLGFAWHPDGRPKDTLANILARREFTVNHVCEDLVAAMNTTSGAYAHEMDEWSLVDVDAAPSKLVEAPRVAQALASFECRMTSAIPLGAGPTGAPSSTVVLAEILLFHIQQGLLQRDARGRLLAIEPARLASVGRLGGIAYTRTNDAFELPRPNVSANETA